MHFSIINKASTYKNSLLFLSVLLFASSAFAFGGGGKSKMFEKEWAQGVDAFGIYLGGDGKPDIDFTECKNTEVLYNGVCTSPCALTVYTSCQTCTVQNGKASISNLADGTSCGDTSVCQSGVCVQTTPPPSNPCEFVSFDTYCQTCTVNDGIADIENETDGKSCGDGKVCKNGACTSSSEPEDPCDTATYDKLCQTCAVKDGVADITDEADGKSCGSGRTCQAGKCISGTETNPCTVLLNNTKQDSDCVTCAFANGGVSNFEIKNNADCTTKDNRAGKCNSDGYCDPTTCAADEFKENTYGRCYKCSEKGDFTTTEEECNKCGEQRYYSELEKLIGGISSSGSATTTDVNITDSESSAIITCKLRPKDCVMSSVKVSCDCPEGQGIKDAACVTCADDEVLKDKYCVKCTDTEPWNAGTDAEEAICNKCGNKRELFKGSYTVQQCLPKPAGCVPDSLGCSCPAGTWNIDGACVDTPCSKTSYDRSCQTCSNYPNSETPTIHNKPDGTSCGEGKVCTNGVCELSLTCSTEHPELCDTEATCQEANGKWCTQNVARDGVETVFKKEDVNFCIKKDQSCAACPTGYTVGHELTWYEAGSKIQKISGGAYCTNCKEENGFGETQECCPGYRRKNHSDSSDQVACEPCTLDQNRARMLKTIDDTTSVLCVNCDDNFAYTAENTAESNSFLHYQIDSYNLPVAHTACNCPAERPFVDGSGNCVRCGLYNTHWDTETRKCVCDDGYVDTGVLRTGYMECVMQGTTTCSLPDMDRCFGEALVLPEYTCTMGCEVKDGKAIFTKANDGTECSIGTCKNGVCTGAKTCTSNANCADDEFCDIPGPKECYDADTQCLFELLGVSYNGLCRPLGEIKKSGKYTYGLTSMSWWAAQNWCEKQGLTLAPPPTDGYTYTIEIGNRTKIPSLDFLENPPAMISELNPVTSFYSSTFIDAIFAQLDCDCTHTSSASCTQQTSACHEAGLNPLSAQAQEMYDAIKSSNTEIYHFWSSYNKGKASCERYLFLGTENETPGLCGEVKDLMLHNLWESIPVDIPYEILYNSSKYTQFLAWQDQQNVLVGMYPALLRSERNTGTIKGLAPLCIAK